jgi:hypothetical protein
MPHSWSPLWRSNFKQNSVEIRKIDKIEKFYQEYTKLMLHIPIKFNIPFLDVFLYDLAIQKCLIVGLHCEGSISNKYL